MDVNRVNSPTPSTESEGQSPSSEDEIEMSKEILMSSLEMKSTKIHKKLTRKVHVEKENEEIKKSKEIDEMKVNESVDSKGSSESDKTKDTKTTTVNLENNPSSSDEYAKHISYNDDGIAIYTDPKTNYKYKWSLEKNTWIPAGDDGNKSDIENPALNDPYENEHYRWCTDKNEWIPKSRIGEETVGGGVGGGDSDKDDENKLENEFYKWDSNKNEWIPKTQTADSNVKYEFVDGQHTYTDNDGITFFWDTAKNAWFPKIDDDFMAIYQMNYGFTDTTALTDTSSGQIDSKKPHECISKDSDLDVSNDKTSSTVAGSAAKRKAALEPPKWFDLPPEQNTKVYVSNLPLDITDEEFSELMGKCGMIMRDPQSQKNKLKLYVDSNGMLKGDGLCDYIKVESVELALNILDGSDVRGKKISVQRAQFQMRGEYNPSLKPKRKKKDKEKLLKMKEKLFDWRPEKMRGERSKHERVVIIKNLFTIELFDKEVALILEYQKDLREECSKCGTVRKVLIYDRHPDGVAQISMGSPEEADIVVQMMNGRFFGQRKLTAELWDGKTKYKIDETEAEVKNRLTNWDKYLETEEEKKLSEAKKLALETDVVATETTGIPVDTEMKDVEGELDSSTAVSTENVLSSIEVAAVAAATVDETAPGDHVKQPESDEEDKKEE